MARTQTQKALSKAKRAGIYCAAQSRKTNDHYGEISQHTRMKPTKQEQLQKVKHKKRLVQGDASFFVLIEVEKLRGSECIGADSIFYNIGQKELDNNYHSC
ncbi:hypothetical protein C1I59_17950 [Paenibacillus polymyxa]|uniref:hypothetical protein n=1 Tax=Paenibacillus polymyxa TaxID=1406 RepID=UPI0010BE225C|nr:hypothetical protein [Paenibacillus polymyxa]TKH34821.1 hypothetical protein C1I59_17950 [Paenibacillus polymyxa]